MNNQQLRVNGTLVDLSQSQEFTEEASALVQRRTRPIVLARNDLQGLVSNVNSRSDLVSDSTPSHYSPAHQFLPGMERLAALPDELVAQMFMEWMDKFPRSRDRQTLYTRVIQRIEKRLAQLESEPDLIDARSNRKITGLFLQLLNQVEVRDQEVPNYTDEELGLT